MSSNGEFKLTSSELGGIQLIQSLSNLVGRSDADTKGSCFEIDQHFEDWAKERFKYNKETEWQKYLSRGDKFVTPCPTAACSQLNPDIRTCSFRLHHMGELLTVDRVLTEKQGKIRFEIPNSILLGKAKVDQAPMMVTRAFITRYSTKGLKYPVRATLCNNKGEMLPLPVLPHTTICNFDGPEDKGVLLFTDMDAVENADAAQNARTWLTYHESHKWVRWMNRLSRFDAQQVRQRIANSSSTDDALVEVVMNYDADTGVPKDFLTWMTGHFFPYLVKCTEEQLPQRQLPQITPDSKSVTVSRQALLSLVDLLEGYGGKKQVVDAQQGFCVQLKIGDNGLRQLLKDRKKEFSEGKVDQADREMERLSVWIEVTLEYFAYKQPHLSHSEDIAPASDSRSKMGTRYLEGSAPN